MIFMTTGGVAFVPGADFYAASNLPKHVLARFMEPAWHVNSDLTWKFRQIYGAPVPGTTDPSIVGSLMEGSFHVSRAWGPW